jgi:glycerate kinase
MHVLLAPDGFGGLLSPQAAAEAMAAGWRAGAPHDEVVAAPLADGGPGFVATVHASLGGRLLPVVVRGPWREEVPATVLLVGDTAYVESAQAAGLALVPDSRRDPTRTTSLGVGDLLRHARATGARRVVVGLGGSATVDGGAGMLAGLGLGGRGVAELGGADGAGPLAGGGAPGEAGPLAGGGGGLAAAVADDLAGLPPLRADWSGVELVVACDVDVPLLGLQGAAAGFAPQKGATPEQSQRLERALAHFAGLAGAALGEVERPNLLAQPVAFEHGRGGARSAAPGRSGADRLAALPGAGAAGGLGFGLALLGARLVPGASVVADAVGLDDRLAASDVVVTGEGRFDWQSLRGKVVSQVAERALAQGVPTVVVAGEVLVGRREQAASGISAAYAVSETPDQLARALADPAGTLTARTAAVARTWSPPPR